MRRILFSLGPLQINSFGFMIALGILAAFFFIHLEARRKGMDEDRVYDFVFWALILGIIGARIGYIVIADPAFYLERPLQMLRLQDGGLSIHGAIVGGLLAGVIFCRRYRISFWRLADLMAPALAIGIAIVRVGCDVFGRPMSHPLKDYVIRKQEARNREIVSMLGRQYSYGHWSVGIIENIGISALSEGLIVKVKDQSGKTVWDARAHNNG